VTKPIGYWKAIREQVRSFANAIDDLRAEVAKSLVGNREVVDGVNHVHSIRRRDNALLEGVPGTTTTN